MRNKERGYLQLETSEGKKWMHFSRTSLTKIQEISGEDTATFADRLGKENSTPEEQFDLMAILVHAGLVAYDLEEGNEIDYNKHKVANWVWDAAQEDENFGLNIVEAFMLSLPISKKAKGQIKQMLTLT